MTASSSRTITATALHHYQGRNFSGGSSSADYLQILRDLTGVAAVNLAHLRDPAAHVSTEVTFSGSFFVPADADLLVDTRLIEIKSGIGRSGSALRDRDVYQLAGYALFDLKDELGITDVSFYSARHGHEVTWSLDRYLELMAGHPLDVGVARRHVEQIIITGEYPEDPFEAIQEARLF